MLTNGVFAPYYNPENGKEPEVLGLLSEYLLDVLEEGGIQERIAKDFRVHERFASDF